MGNEGQRRGRGCWCVSLLLFFGVEVSAQIRYSIPEEVKDGTVVGNIAKDLGLDIGSLAYRRFRIVSGSEESLFEVNQDSGVLRVHKNIDREALCEGSNACVINLKTVVENPLEVHYVAVEIVDVNDHAPSFPEKEKRLEIAENTLPSARFQLRSARDPDGGVNSVRSYKIIQNEHFDLDVRDSGDEKMPFLILQKSLDRERKSQHSLILTAADGGTPPRTGTLNVTVTVLDVNDNRPVFDEEVYTVNLQENAALDTVVVKISATDQDDGVNGDVEYTLGSDLNPKIYKLFHLDKDTGEIRVKGEADFEDTEIYRLDVQATDKGQPPTTGNCRVIIKLLDVNDNKPEIDVTSFSNAVSEDSKPGTVISLISVRDKDSGVNGKVVCSLTENVPFELKPSFSENMYSLVTKSALDRERMSRYDITIRASDLGQPPMSSEKTLSVQISDVNDNPPEFPSNPLELYLEENNTPSAPIFSVSASDKDVNDNAVITYSIVRGDGTHDLTSFLNINPENGDVRALKSFDFERVKAFSFQIMAKDSGKPSLSSNVTVNVFILDQNDNVPVILSPLSANGSSQGVEEVPRNANAGHLVTKVRAYDPDVGYNGWLLFSLQEVSDHTLFGLDRYTGQIRTLRSFSETDEARHKLVLLVRDNGNVSFSATATIVVNVVEPKEAFAASDIQNSVTEDDTSATFYLIVTLGSVSALFIISVIVLMAMQCSKPTDSSSKCLQDANYDGTLCHSIQYRSGDKRYMLVGPRMSIGSTIVPGSNGNTLIIPERRRRASGEDCVYPGWILQHRASQAHSHTGMHADG
ncbi:protocadherin alpha-6-like isoform X15 [Denticeps clupeoides]|uniref:protocadherin alpha-6-like isoform X15 n=1 Tax=Denticeps clupeoides TaxID=299321 RepID=UPI0010A4CE3F|nr:protocadherin alpha-6-like isoform X15 [Denticeps clupeoides]